MALSESLQHTAWKGTVPIRISLSPLDCRNYDASLPFMIHAPRLSYLPLLLQRLRDFFACALINPNVSPQQGWFSFDGAPLKWQYPIGLLVDLVTGTDPVLQKHRDYSNVHDEPGGTQHASPLRLWDLTVHFSNWPVEHLIPLDASEKTHQEVFMQSVKEADYLRNGTAKTVMLLSKDDSNMLWESVRNHDLSRFAPLYRRFLHPQSGEAIRHVPLKIYIPQSLVRNSAAVGTEASNEPKAGFKVVQGLIAPINNILRVSQTMGSALHSLLPTLFPSRTMFIHAKPVLHGVVIPLNTRLEDLMQGAVFCDGFLHIAVHIIDFGQSG